MEAVQTSQGQRWPACIHWGVLTASLSIILDLPSTTLWRTWSMVGMVSSCPQNGLEQQEAASTLKSDRKGHKWDWCKLVKYVCIKPVLSSTWWRSSVAVSCVYCDKFSSTSRLKATHSWLWCLGNPSLALIKCYSTVLFFLHIPASGIGGHCIGLISWFSRLWCVCLC